MDFREALARVRQRNVQSSMQGQKDREETEDYRSQSAPSEVGRHGGGQMSFRDALARVRERNGTQADPRTSEDPLMRIALQKFEAEQQGITWADVRELAQSRKKEQNQNRIQLGTELLHPERRAQQDGVQTIPYGVVQATEPFRRQLQTETARQQKYSGQSYTQLKEALSALPEGEEKTWLEEYAPSVMTAADYDSELESMSQELEQLEQQRNQLYNVGGSDFFDKGELQEMDQLQDKIKTLSQKKAQLERNRKYGFLSENVDYVDGSAYRPELYGQNSAYKIINGDGRQWGSVHESAKRMTQEEIANYNYLFHTEGEEAAQEYMRYLMPTLNSRKMEQVAANAQEVAEAYPALADFASISGTLLGGVGMLDALGQRIVKDVSGDHYASVDYNRTAMAPSVINSTIRGTRAQNLAEKHGTIQFDEAEHPILSRLLNGKSWGDVYQLGMSMVDSTATAVLSPVLGPGATLLLGGSSATQTMLDAAENGATDEQALTMGALAGAFEYLFEKYELESLIGNIDDGVLKALFKQSLSEGFGEGMTTIANYAADTLIMAEKSELSRLTAEYIAKDPTLTEAQARKEALKDMAIQTGWDIVGGMASGGIMGGTGAGVNKVTSKLEQLAMEKVTADQKALRKLAIEKVQAEQQAQTMENTAPEDGVKYSIKRTQNMSWEEQIDGVLSHDGSVVHSDTMVLDDTPATLVNDGIESKKLAIPLSVITKAKSGKDASHSIKDANLKDLQRGVRNAPIMINNPARNAIVFVTDIKQDGAPVLVAFQKNAQFDGDDVHKATSIHLQMDVASMLKALPADATVYAKNESELGTAAGITDSLRSISAGVKFTGNTVTENVAGVNGEISSAEGKILRGKDAVEVADIASAGGGKLTVALTDGSTADVSELSFPDAGKQELWRVLAEYADNAEAARQLLKEYRAGELGAYEYARGVEEGFLYGKLNIGAEEMSQRGSYVNLLNPMQRNAAYQQGQYAGEKQTNKRQAEVSTAKKTGNEKQGKLHYEGDRNKLTERQKISLQACEVVAKALGIQVYVFESKRSSAGKRVGENGWYDPGDGSIHIDLYAGESGEGVMVFTLAHELVHFIKDWSPQKFRTLAGFLAEQYGKKGLSARDMILLQQKKAENNGRKLTFEQAHEEWVADSMEMMLSDGAILKKLSMLQGKDASLAQKIRQFLDKFLQRLKAAYSGISPQTTEGQIVAEMVDAAQQLRDLFADALTDAGENFRSAEKNTTGEGGVRFMSREDSTRIKKQLVAAADRLNSMDVVVSVVSDGFAGMRDSDIAKKLEKEFSKFGNKVDRQNFGIILLEYQQINKALNYLKLPGEKAALLTVPRVLKRGIQIDAHTKHKERGVDSYTFAAPVEINGKRGNVGVVVQRVTGTNRFKTLRILLPNGKAFEFVKNIEADSTTGSSSKRQGSEGIPIESASKNSIRNSDGVVKENDSTERQASARSDGAVSDRAMLADMFEQMVTNSNEYKALENYRKHMQEMLEVEEHLERVTAEIRRLSFAEGPRDTETLNKLKLQQKQAVNRLNIYDGMLLRLEKSGVLRAMIERNRKKITQESFDRAREYYRERNERRESEIRQYYRESRRKAMERHDMAEVRQKIRKDVKRLDSLLNKGTKNKNVKQGLQEFVGAALRLAKGVFLNDYNEYDMIRAGLTTNLLQEEKAAYARCRELLQELDRIRDENSAEPGADNLHDRWDPEKALRQDDREEALKRELSQNMRILREGNVFQRERGAAEDATAEQLANELLSAYQKLEESGQAHIQGIYSQKVYDQIETVRDFLKGKAIKDMTSVELRELQKLYRMVSEVVSTADELFGAHKKEKVSERGNRILEQLITNRSGDMPVFLAKLEKFGLSILSPAAAAEIIGSETLRESVQEIIECENVEQRDLEHAHQYAAEQAKKYNRKQWDTSKQVEFGGTQITIGQAMLFYAHSRREKSREHLEGDGFVHSKDVPIRKKLGKLPGKIAMEMNSTKVYRATGQMYDEMEQLLTKDQREYVKTMQDYLSQVMGAKGNETSMELYGVELFGEKFYVPIVTAKEFMDSPLGAKKGERTNRNAGFTNATVEGADNAIVLEDFETVWARHVQEMSNYHAYAVALENFNRLYNYHPVQEQETTDKWGQTVIKEVEDTKSVKTAIQNKLGAGMIGYIQEWMENINGEARGDRNEKIVASLLTNFRKTAVLGSGSVIIQQPTAIIRAAPYLDPGDIAGWMAWKMTGKPEDGLVREMYRYCPVAGRKKIGGFDPSAGRTVRQYLFDGRDDGKNRLVKGTDSINEFLGKAPEKADELAWSYLWLCCKKKTKRQNPALRAGSKEHCEEAAKLFSQIVRETQVYDSVMSKPLIMQKKGMFWKNATSFMNEPLRGVNQVIMAVTRAIHGEITWTQAVYHWTAVQTATWLAGAFASIFYALRDDDDDETYWEKYRSALAGKTLDGLNPLSNIPILQDIVSIFQGYGSERSEFATVSGLVEGTKKLFAESKAETPEEIEKEIWDKLELGGGQILNFFGLPGRNLIREIRGVYFTVKRTATRTWPEATDAGMRYAVLEGITGKTTSKVKQMENAVAEDDPEHLLRVMGTYDDPADGVSEMVSATRDAWLAGRVTDDRAMEYLQEYGGKSLEDAAKYIIKWEFKKAHPKSGLTRVLDYIEFCEPAGISLDVFEQYCKKVEGLTSDRDEDGKAVNGSKKAKILDTIDDLPISRKQKDALYLSNGYDEDKLDEAPWN